MLQSIQLCAVSQPGCRDCLKDPTIVQRQGYSCALDDDETFAKIPNDEAERDGFSLLKPPGLLGVDKRLRPAGIDLELDRPLDDPPIKLILRRE